MTEYLIFASDNGEVWELPEGCECAGSSADSAVRTFIDNLDWDAPHPKHIAAIPARSWKPRKVTVETKRKVSLA